VSHDLDTLCRTPSVQQLLSNEMHGKLFEEVKSMVPVRSRNLMLACTMPHASDWLVAPPIPALGLGLQSEVFRTALKYRLHAPPVLPLQPHPSQL